ncbi:MAG: hypothetical protein ABSF83_12305 [Nitrososphaerales archaeon]|jgi:uncharacterized C2H2 Zn-finger protein
MRSKCPKCGAVFEHGLGLGSLLHVAGSTINKCPACGHIAMMYNHVTDPITWPPEAGKKAAEAQPPPTDEELQKKRLDDSKYEDSSGS